MRLQQTIKQLLALAMLVVFAFSITPQKTIHDFVAPHKDPTKCYVHDPIGRLLKKCKQSQ